MASSRPGRRAPPTGFPGTIAAHGRAILSRRDSGGRALQDLPYAYDPMGNITSVHDGAQAPVYRNNAELAASNDYRYDALYRLVEATGREHEGQAANGRGPADVVPLRASSPSDPKAMRRYVQRYRYDAVGNLTTLQHFAGAGSWRREYAYGEHGNRLRATGNAAVALHERYEHDVAGNIVAMPHLSRMHWDELGQLEYVRRGNDHVWLQYAGGARVRKLVLRGQGVVEDRRYLGAEELYTKRRGKAGGGAVVEQTLTEHAGGGLQVDVRLVVDGKTIAKPVALRRYAVADHLGSCKVEVDPDGGVIAYEEFHPYGTTSYRAMRSGLDAAAGRYRFTGMERDEETGLAQHGARCYAGWLGRWVSADPIGVGDGVNRFAYCRGSPVGCVDTDGCAAKKFGAGAGVLVTTGRGSGGRGPTLLGTEDDEQFAGEEVRGLEVDPAREDRIAAQQERRHARTEYLLRGGGLEAAINAQRAQSGRIASAYFGVLILPALLLNFAAVGTGARVTATAAAAFDVDQVVASVRGAADNRAVASGAEATIASGYEAAGMSPEDANVAAGWTTLGVGLALGAGAGIASGRGRWTRQMRRAIASNSHATRALS